MLTSQAEEWQTQCRWRCTRQGRKEQNDGKRQDSGKKQLNISVFAPQETATTGETLPTKLQSHQLLKHNLPYILESNPRPFYSFRGLKNQMRIRFAVESWILEKW